MLGKFALEIIWNKNKCIIWGEKKSVYQARHLLARAHTHTHTQTVEKSTENDHQA
jgi:hypothetical protein